MQNKEIGGYFGLELKVQYDNVKDYIALNSARNALRYIIRAFNINEIYVPFYTCPVVFDSIKRENCKIKFYHINDNFLPIEDIKEDSFILYTNYFGICNKNVITLSKKYKNLIIDNAQSFYMKKYGIAGFNSIRKFFGVPDGALLYCNKSTNYKYKINNSYHKSLHLLKRIDISAESAYDEFLKNEETINNDDIELMSNLTYKIFNSIDINSAKKQRLTNFKYLSKHLSIYNNLNYIIDKESIPMVYPYFSNNANEIKTKLIKNKIYIPTYWKNLDTNNSNTFEKHLINNLIALPIDHRYNTQDMDRILDNLMQ
ncbi:MAG: hypothetical protein ACI37S_00265 [Candidatus Gastranaerophilaceae bacterium]